MSNMVHTPSEEWHGRNTLQLAFLDPTFCRTFLRRLLGQPDATASSSHPRVQFEVRGWTVVLETSCLRIGVWCVHTLGEDYSELLRSFQLLRDGGGVMRKVLLFRQYSGQTPLHSVVSLFRHENIDVVAWSDVSDAKASAVCPEWTVDRLVEICRC